MPIALQPDTRRTNSTIFVQFEETYCNQEYVDDVVRGRFSFNGESYSLGRQIDWLKNPSGDIEWHILLHKFYYAPGLIRCWSQHRDLRYLMTFQHLVQSWIEQTPANFIAADVTARRLQNWAYAWYLLVESDDASHLSNSFVADLHASVTTQTRCLLKTIAPVRNHRTLELYAILVVSLAFPTLPDAPAWQEWSISELNKNMSADLRPDGVHCEQSTDYHHIVLRSFLLAAKLIKANRLEPIRDHGGSTAVLRKALDFAMHIHRPDGKIPALSDSDSRSFVELLDWGADLFGSEDYAYVASAGQQGRKPAFTNVHFPTGGYTVFRSEWTNGSAGQEPFSDARYLVLDSGPIGAGNHGHMDMLSVEVAAFGQPLIVDPGRYTYHEPAFDASDQFDWRHAFRSSRAHNTVTVDNLDQGRYFRSRPSARHKVHAPHPSARVVAKSLHTDPAWLHSVVDSPRYSPVHHRVVWFIRQQYWLILDRLVNPENTVHDYALRFQLSAAAGRGVELDRSRESVVLTSPLLVLGVTTASSCTAALEQGWISETYGYKSASPRLRVRQRAQSTAFLSVILPVGCSDHRQRAVRYSEPEETLRTLTVNLNGCEDVWQWDAREDLLIRGSANSQQRWALNTGIRHA